SQGVVNNDGTAIGEGFDRMADISRHDSDQTRPGNLRDTVDRNLDLALDQLPDFFLGMEVFVNGGASFEVVMRECHARGMKIPSIPARQALDHIETGDV